MSKHAVIDQDGNVVDRFLPASTRQYLNGLLPMVTAVLVAFGLAENSVTLWVSVVASVLGAGIAFFNTAEVWRKWLYGIAVGVQPLVVFYGVFDENQAAVLVAAAGTVLAQGVAAAFTLTGPLQLTSSRSSG